MSCPSLVSHFDAVACNQFVLAQGTEAEFQKFVRNVQIIYVKWFETEKEVVKLREELRKCNQHRATLEIEVKHARNQIKFEFERRRKVENDRVNLEKQIEMIRTLLNDKNKSILDEKDMQKLAFLNSYQRSDGSKKKTDPYRIRDSSASCLSDISYDVTDDDLEASVTKEYDEGTPPKRQRMSNERESSIITKTSIHLDPQSGQPKATTTTEINMPKLNKSFSEPALDVQFKTTGVGSDGEEHEEVWNMRPGTTPKSKQKKFKLSHHRTQSESETSSASLRKATSASSGLNRIHSFNAERVLVKPEYCQLCSQKFKFGSKAMRCKECKSICHFECKDQLPIPCVPVHTRTPGLTKSDSGVISDYAGSDFPMIPGIIQRLATEVERRGLTEVGIYRMSGSKREVRELKEKFFKGKGAPNLSLVDDIHVVCCCLKDFIQNLKDTLITYQLRGQFVKAVVENGKSNTQIHAALYEAISQLPHPNRDTLAFIIKHLQLVAQSPECLMPKENLAKVFGPTIIGFSSPNPDPDDIWNETKVQSLVMQHLLDIPTDYWNSFLMLESYTENHTPNTPEERHVLHSMLGPVGITPTGPNSNKKFTTTATTTTTSYTPKFGLKNSKMPNKRTKHFFASPNLE